MSTFSGRATSVAPESGNLLTNFLYPGGTPSFTLTSLDPGQQYILTLYSMGFEDAGGRRSYIATSDGSVITDVDQDEFGALSGQLLTCYYIANNNGIFSWLLCKYIA